MIDKIKASILDSFHFTSSVDNLGRQFVDISTPFYYGDGDGMSFYLYKDEEGYYLIDEDTMWRHTGCDVDKDITSAKKMAEFHGSIMSEKDGLITRVEGEKFGEAIFTALHTAIEIDKLEK